MKRWFGLLILPCLFAPAIAAAQPPPLAPERPVTDTYFGRAVVDPYRWMEDLRSPDTKGWLDAQAAYTRAVLDSMPGRKAFAERARYFLDAEPFTISELYQAGGNTFFVKRARGADQGLVVVRPAGGGAERTLLDLDTLGTPGHHVALTGISPSGDGTRIAVVVQEGGTEIGMVRIIDVATGKLLDDSVTYVAGVPLLDTEGKRLYYTVMEKKPLDASDRYRVVRGMVHTVGTAVANDTVFAGKGAPGTVPVPDYAWPFYLPIHQGRWALVFVIPGVDAAVEVWVRPTSGDAPWHRLASLDDRVSDAYIHGDDVYLVSLRDAPNGRVLRVDAHEESLAKATVVVPETDDVLTSGEVVGTIVLLPASDALYLRLLRKGAGQVMRIPYDARRPTSLIPLPQGLQVTTATSSDSTPGVMLQLASWTQPGDFYRYDPTRRVAQPLGLAGRNTVDLTDLVSEKVMVKGKDGTPIPLTIIHRKGVRMDGSAPTVLYGYGAYGVMNLPRYQRGANAWFERGGIFALAHVRGGGELGERWHEAGKKETKHNTWEDYIACAHYLIDKRYTSSAKLGAWGESAGGILIGRAVTTEPSLFAAAIDGVPVSDAMRVELDATGPANIAEFGSVKTREGAEALYAMSPLHHVVKGMAYPAMLVTAGANDPRVPPWQGGKMAAALQAATTGGPVLLRVNADSGHGWDTTAQRVSDNSDNFTFLLWRFGDPDFQPKEL